ncbi:MAG: ompA2, partial [Magnetococcales bacterium]|nr:ompA2 [Magnetococcales bacterium]
MGSKLRRYGVLVSLAGMLMVVGNAGAQEVTIPWQAGGWSQWHPHQSDNILGRVGTQLYFSPADAVAEKAPEKVAAAPVAVSKPDSDGDGIADDLDKCPGTPKGAVVDATGCDPDPDGDGVRREDDKCPNTPAGVAVNAEGCWIIGKVLFRFDNSKIQKKYKPELKKVSESLGKYPDMKVDIQGHTDSVGSD